MIFIDKKTIISEGNFVTRVKFCIQPSCSMYYVSDNINELKVRILPSGPNLVNKWCNGPVSHYQ